MMTSSEIVGLLLSIPHRIRVTYKDGRTFSAKFAGFADGRHTLVFWNTPTAPAEVWVDMIQEVEILEE